jgi:hypothetical protein
MNLNMPIPTQSIQSIRQLAEGHPVFLVNLENDCLVVKAEETNANRNLKDPLEIMNVIDPNAFTRVLTKPELMGLYDWVRQNGDSLEESRNGYMLDKLSGALRPPMPPQVRGGPILRMQEGVWIVMHAKANLKNLEGAGKKRQEGDKTEVREIAKALNEPGTLEKLGEIIAADAFNGNQDRVNFEGRGEKWEETGQRLECIQNAGNFFVAQHGRKSTVFGLDSFDLTNQFKNLDTFGKASEGFNYPGTILRQDAGPARQALAQKIVNDMETILGPRNRKIIFASTKRLPPDATARIVRGMQSGALKILNYLKQKYRGRPQSQAFQERLRALGWTL